MSRLTPLAIPFIGGHTDEIDEKLLPNGVFADVSNGRLPQPGGLRLRRGWRPVTMTTVEGSPFTAVDLFSYNDSLVALTNVFALATLVESNATRPWVVDSFSRVPQITQVRVVGNFPPLSTSVLRASAAVTADGVYGCVLQQTATMSVFRVFELATDETIVYTSLANGARVRKVFSMGAVFGLVENTGAALILHSLDPTAGVVTGSEWTPVATLVTAAVTQFDVAVATDTTPTLIHLGDVVGAVGSYRQFTFAGGQNGSTKTVAAATCQAITLCSNDTVVHCVTQDSVSAELSLTSFDAPSPFTTLFGPTAVNAGVAVAAQLFCVGMRTVGGVIYVACEHAATVNGFKDCSWNLVDFDHSPNTRVQHLGNQLWGGFLTRGSIAAVGFARDSTTYYQDQSEGPWFFGDFGLADTQDFTAHLPFWPGLSPTGHAIVLLPRDETPDLDLTPRGVAVRTLRLGSTERRPAAQLGNALHITGGVLTQWTGGLSELGMTTPIIAVLTPSNSTGTIANGSYSYRTIAVWQDEKLRTHRSVVSDAETTTLAGANDTVTATVYIAKTLRRSGNNITTPRVELYRTEAGPGELFYRVASTSVTSATDDTVTLVDTMPDANIIDEAILYTQSEFGATSGMLDMCPARPSAFITATKRRLVLGSADTSYQWSQVAFPETAMWFAEPGVVGDAAQAYFDDVEAGRITGVAALDEVVFAGTANRIYVTGGTGPNLAGTGEFSPPIQLPADVGFYNHLSILPTSEGLWFLGLLNTFYLIARGTPAPVISSAVQDRLTTAVVGCGYDASDNLAAWASAAGQLILRQLDTQQWLGDSLPFTPIALHSHQGVLYAIASNGVVWQYHPTAYGDGASGATAVALRVATGQIGPFEMSGWGRLAVIELLGEFQTAAALLAEISYDDGLTWTSLGTHTVTGLSAGATFQLQWYPARQRGQRFRVRFTMTPSVTTTEGCRLTGCVVQYAKRSGPTRLAAANRK